jgi:heat shock protein HslJ
MKMTKLTLLVSTLALGVFALSGCGLFSADDNGGGGVSVDGTSWTLTEIDGAAPAEGSVVTIQFADGAVNGSAGCNTYRGSYTLDGGQAEFSQMASTRMACLDEAVTAQENRYLELLQGTLTLAVDGDTLTITTADGAVLKFASAEL